MNKANYSYKTMVILNAERKKKLDYICEKEVRNKTNMIAVLIDNHYQELQKKEQENDRMVIKEPIKEDFKETIELNFKKKEIGDYKKPPHEVYERLLKLKGSGWEGNLEESRE